MPSPLEYRVETQGVENAAERVTLETGAGAIRCRFHPAQPGTSGIVWIFGAGGGWGGPGSGLYVRLAREFQAEGVASIEVDYRRPGNLARCVEDALTGTAFLGEHGARRMVVVGHSFGGAVAIRVGVISEWMVGVAALSSQTFGAEGVHLLSPKPLLLIHGEDDEVLPVTSSLSLYRSARPPKRLHLYPGCRHGLDECREEVSRDLAAWLRGLRGE